MALQEAHSIEFRAADDYPEVACPRLAAGVTGMQMGFVDDVEPGGLECLQASVYLF